MPELLSDLLYPELSSTTQTFIRIAYGVLLLGTLLMALPQGRRFFVSERWGGYGKSSPEVDLFQNPIAYPVVMVVWLLCGTLIAVGWWSVWAALVNLLLCRYFFVHMRWKGILRGMGAPGFVTYWLAAAVFLLEFTSHYTPDLMSLALLVLLVDFAFIFLSAGLYKFTAGYPRNYGMELGMVNPQWGYWWRFYAKLPPGHWSFKTLNQLAWATEIVAAVLMLVPQTRFLGALLIVVGFIFIATQIRLGFLCQMVMVGGALFFHPGSFGDQWVDLLVPASASSVAPDITIPALISPVLEGLLWAYIFLLPLAHGGLFYNFYAHKPLPWLFQRALEIYTNFFGIIIWRVFSVDVVNFFIRIYYQPRVVNGSRTLVSQWGRLRGLRYSHVGESITVTSVFTTLKYYPSNSELFIERLLRYASTVPCSEDAVLAFQYVSIVKTDTQFEYVPVAEYIVDIAAGTVSERVLNDSISVRATHDVSPVYEGARPGSYAPLVR